MIDVAAGLIQDGAGRLLACRRPEEPGEIPAAALVRELEEELGILVETTAGLTPVVWDYGRGPIRLHPFLCRIVSGVPHPHEHSEIRWCGPGELEALDWAEADVPVLAEWQERSGR
jgi:8-oxo-dGTP diphosphatase